MLFFCLASAALFAAPASASTLLSPTVLGTPAQQLSAQFAGCSMQPGTLTANCSATVLGRKAELIFAFGDLQVVTSYTLTFSQTLTLAEATQLYNAACAELRRAFAEYGEQKDSQRVRRWFATPKRALAWAAFDPLATAGAQVAIAVQVVPFATTQSAAPPLRLKKFDLSGTVPNLAR